ncbi:LOW QUALITY PROTEIN: proline-rich protein 18 [Zalophus californianus]|uniref:LOW QUALITY PROTEIN: proline-rich protein 18 n=1 Tax=Zalophus californianus TaxID=9704 RepID=A0A6P9FMH7_ZALCA|nr:LOW QUALITY PROTEIN: proline-rich protein 18 [Zalophus californianus]
MTRRLDGTMPFPPTPPRAAARSPGVPAARAPPRRSGAPRRAAAPTCAPPAPSPPAAAAEKRRPSERPEGLLSGSWPSTTLKRPPARRAPRPSPSARPRPGPPAPAPSYAGAAGPDAAVRFSLSLTPEAVLLLQRRHLEKQLLVRPCRPPPSPSADARRLLGPCPCARPAGPGRRPPPPGPLQAPAPRPALPVSLLNERHKYDDVEYEEEPPVADEGLVRKCTEWLRGVEKAAAARDHAGPLDTLPHLSTL